MDRLTYSQSRKPTGIVLGGGSVTSAPYAGVPGMKPDRKPASCVQQDGGL